MRYLSQSIAPPPPSPPLFAWNDYINRLRILGAACDNREVKNLSVRFFNSLISHLVPDRPLYDTHQRMN